MIAANPCQQRHPNSYLAESEDEVQNILNPRLGDIAIISTADGTSTYRLREPEDVPEGASSIPSNKCEYVWVLSASPISGLATVINVDADPYNARGTGIDDDTERIQQALNDGAGMTVYFGPGKNYLITSSLTVGPGTTIIAYGARVFNTVDNFSLFILDSGSRVMGMELEGTGSGTFNNAGRAFEAIGVVGAYKSRIAIQDCHIHDFSGYAVYAEFIEGLTVIGNEILDMAFSGVMCLSVTNAWVTRNHIKGFGPGSGGTAYGVAFTRESTNTSLAVFPRSKSCKADLNIIEDNTIWEALDTHGGDDIQFIGNTIRNCAIGIAMVTSHLGGVPDWAPQQCRAIGNTVYGLGTGIGIALTGASVSEVSITEFAERNVILGNTLVNCGEAGNSLSGAIYYHTTKDTIVASNVVLHARPHGIQSYHNNWNQSINGNTIKDPWSDSVSVPSGIAFRSGLHSGTVSGNSLVRENAALGVNVAVRGIWVTTPATTEIHIGKQWNSFTTPYVGTIPSINYLGKDNGGAVLTVDPANDTASMGGVVASAGYLLTVNNHRNTFANGVQVRNDTADGGIGVQVKSDTANGNLVAFSATTSNPRLADKIGVSADSNATALGLWAMASGQRLDIYAGSDVLTAQFDGSVTAGHTRFLIYDVDSGLLQRVKVGANGTGPGGVGRALYVDNV